MAQKLSPSLIIDRKSDRYMKNEIGQPIIRIPVDKVAPCDEPVTSAEEAEVLCSYNWVEDKSPTIFSPGGAPVWTLPPASALPARPRPADGPHYADQNAKRVPNHTFEAVAAAVAAAPDPARLDRLDVLINRNSLRRLLEICLAKSAKDSFCVRLYLMGDRTLVVERVTNPMLQRGRDGTEPFSWGYTFEEAFSAWPTGLERSSGHHRVLKYRLGGLACAVRFEVDAQYHPAPPAPPPDPDSVAELLARVLVSADDGDGDDAAAAAAASAPSPPRSNRRSRRGGKNSPTSPPPGSGGGSSGGAAAAAETPIPSSVVAVIPRGQPVPQSAAAEIKSRTEKAGRVKIQEILPQMWFGRTRHLIVGRHDGAGLFHSVEASDMTARLLEWEQEDRIQLGLRRVAGLLERVREAVRAEGRDRPCLLVWERGLPSRELGLFRLKQQGRRPVSREMATLLWGEHAGDAAVGEGGA